MPAHLTRTERTLLEYLAAHPRRIRTEQLIELLWNYGLNEPEDPYRTLRQHILHLRRKIAFAGLVITNIPWHGYMLEIQSPASQLELPLDE